MEKAQRRKDIRLKDYDYSQDGYYFITICTKDKRSLLSTIVTGGFQATSNLKLITIGNEIIKTINFIQNQHSCILFDKYVIMPNHIHLIIIIQASKLIDYGNQSLDKIVGQLKSYTNKMYNDSNNTKNVILWQRNYYEHIIRSEKEYKEIWEHIETNPMKWSEDKYFV